MPDIYGREQQYKPTKFKSIEEAIIKVSGGAEELGELLVQDFNFNYTNNVGQAFEIGSNFTYLLPGRSRGNFTMGRIIGAELAEGVFGAFGSGVWASDGCDEEQILTFSVSDACGEGGSSKEWIMAGIALNNYGVGANANQIILQENIGGIFLAMEIK